MSLPDSAKQPVLYHLHIPKTAGTTVHGMLRSHFEDNRIASTNPLNVLKLPAEKLQDFDFFGGHLEFGYYLPQLTNRPVHSVVFIRDPRKILLSMYKHVRGAKRDPMKPYVEANCPTLIEYLRDPVMAEYIHNPQTRYLGISERKITPEFVNRIRAAATSEETQAIINEANSLSSQTSEQVIIARAHERLRECSLVGIVDHLDESLNRVCDLRNWQLYQEIRSRNVSPVKVESVSDMPAEVIERLDELTKWDRELYDAAVEIFHEQGKRAPASRTTFQTPPSLAKDGPATTIKLANVAGDRPMRVGIWCWYNVTLEPSEGIGVFAHHLAKALAALPNGPILSIFTKPGEQHLVQETVAAGNGRIQAISCGRPPVIRRRLRRIGKVLGKPAEAVRNFADRIISRTRRRTFHSIFRGFFPLPHQFRRKTIGRVIDLSAALLTSPITIVLFLLNRILAAVMQEVRDCAAYVYNTCCGWIEAFERHEEEEIQAYMKQCDLWVIPYVGLNRDFPTATVVTIHDLVGYHFPEVLPPARLAKIKEIVNKVAEQSSVAACLSEFIRDNDLYGQLNLSPEKVRVVKPGMHDNFGDMCREEEATASKPLLNKKYIFYPAAFRAYKNHDALVEALNILRMRGRDDIHVVFTGMSEAPEKIKVLLEKYKLQDNVHVLNKVSRPELALLYHKALGTIVPSLYEQGSFPLVEALHWNCPVAASNIPALREQFAPIGDAMLYFGTHDYQALADVIEKLDADRANILQAQQVGWKEMCKRSWVDAAAEWMDVFQLAIARHRQQRGQMRRENALKKAA